MVVLFAHQRESVDRMAALETAQQWVTPAGLTMPTQTGVLANAIGSGKTFTLLWFLHEAAIKRPEGAGRGALPARLWCRADPGSDAPWGGAWLTGSRAGLTTEVGGAAAASGTWSGVNVVICTRALVSHWEAEWRKDAALQHTVPLCTVDEPADVEAAATWALQYHGVPGVEPLLVVSDGLVGPWLEATSWPTAVAVVRRWILDDIQVCPLPRVTTRPWVLLAHFVWVLSSTPDDVTKWAGRRVASFPQLVVTADPGTWIQVPIDTRMAITDVAPPLVHRVRRVGALTGAADVDDWGLSAGVRTALLRTWATNTTDILRQWVEARVFHVTPVTLPVWLRRWWAWRTDVEREAEALAPRRQAAEWRRRRTASEALGAAWPQRWVSLEETARSGYSRVCPICHEEPGSEHRDLPAGPGPAPWHPDPAVTHLARWTVWTACCVQQFCAPCWWAYYQHSMGTSGGSRRRRREVDDLVDPLGAPPMAAMGGPASRPRTRAQVSAAVAGGGPPGPDAGPSSSMTWDAVAYRVTCPFCRTPVACPLGDLAWAPAVSTAGQVPDPVYVARVSLDVTDLPRPMDIFGSLLRASPDIRLLIVSDQHGTWEAFAEMWVRAATNECLVDVSGTARQMHRKLEQFRTGKARALFLNADVHSAGVHLPEATDVCLLQDFDPATTRQIIGRAARFPRPPNQPLRVHRFQFSML